MSGTHWRQIWADAVYVVEGNSSPQMAQSLREACENWRKNARSDYLRDLTDALLTAWGL
jgi:hypothetical protein